MVTIRKNNILEILIHVCITSRLEYCNSVLYGLPDSSIHKLQRIQKAYARLIYCCSKFCHQILYEPSGLWSGRLSPVSVVLSE